MQNKYVFQEYIQLGKNKIYMNKVIVYFSYKGHFCLDIFTFHIGYMDEHDHALYKMF